MNKNLLKQQYSVTDFQKLEELIEIRQRNNKVKRLLCNYLEHYPKLISSEIMRQMRFKNEVEEELAYCSLLAEFCGLNPDENNNDRMLINQYFRPGIKKYSIKNWSNNPYLQEIIIPEICFNHWETKYENYNPYEAFVYDDIRVTSDYREIPCIGFVSETFSFPVVTENNHEWMAIKPNEIETMKLAIDLVQGNVVTFGLGMGYFAFMASRKENVQQVTIVENNEQIIQLFQQQMLPQYVNKNKIRICCCNAIDFMITQMPNLTYDYAFVDLWHDISDGIDIYREIIKIERILQQTKFLYWIEESLLSALRWQQFDAIVETSHSYEEIIKRLSEVKTSLSSNIIIK